MSKEMESDYIRLQQELDRFVSLYQKAIMEKEELQKELEALKNEYYGSGKPDSQADASD